MDHRFACGVLAVCLLAILASAQNKPPAAPVIDPATPLLNQINDVSCILYSLIMYTSAGIAALLIMLAGLEHMTSEDDNAKRNRAKTRVIYALAGLILVILACPIVDYIVTNTKILPFQRACDCLGGKVKPTTTTTLTTTTTTTTFAGGTTTTTTGGTTTTTIISSSKILIYTTGIDQTDPMDLTDLKTFLESEGHTTDLVMRPDKLSAQLLSGYGLVWIAETQVATHPDQAEIDALVTYRNSGGNLVLTGEGATDLTANLYVAFVNDIANKFGVTYTSPIVINNNILSCAPLAANAHPVINGVSTLSSTGSDATVSTTNGDVKTIATFEGKTGIMTLEGTSGQGNIVFDNSQVRFTKYGDPNTYGPNACDNAKYIRNIVAWAGI
jgi:hypothetical protein